MGDRGPGYRVWPPVAVGGPLLLGVLLTAWAGDPLSTTALTSALGWLLVAVFAVWNGWALLTVG